VRRRARSSVLRPAAPAPWWGPSPERSSWRASRPACGSAGARNGFLTLHYEIARLAQ
jgi:hypothetical protein